MNFRSLSIRIKLGLIITSILAMVLICVVWLATIRYQTVEQMGTVLHQARLTSDIGELTHHVQIERAASTLYVGSKGIRFKDELAGYRTETDVAILALHAVMHESRPPATPGEIEYTQLLANADSCIGELGSIRSRIDSMNISTTEIITYFSNTVVTCLAVIPSISRSTSLGDLTTAICSYSAFQEGKERTGQERAIITALLSSDHLSESERLHLINVTAQQDTFFEFCRTLSSAEFNSFFDRTMSDPAVTEAHRIRKVVLANSTGDHFGVDAEHWFQVITHTIDLMKVVGDSAAVSLVNIAESHRQRAIIELAWILAMAALTGICAIVSILVVRVIARDTMLLAQQARMIGAGDLRDVRRVVTSNDEIGQLSQVMATMAEGLKSQLDQSRSTVENLAAATAQILSSTQQQAASAQQHAASIQETSTTMEEIRQTGQQVAERSRQVASSAEATSSAGVTGQQAVEDMAKTMEGIRSQVESVAERIVTLSEKTQAIGEIIATVTDIAERANILALNAGIEAAGAGEHGSRFAVVAHELKGLADQAKDSTIQVRTILSDIQKGINSSVMLAEDAVKISDSGRHRSQSAQQAIRQFVNTTEGSVQAFQQIVAATNQQFIGFDQISQALKDMRMSSQQATASILGLEQAAKGLNDLGQKLRSAEGKFVL